MHQGLPGPRPVEARYRLTSGPLLLPFGCSLALRFCFRMLAKVCASAVGYYGSRGDEELTEESAAGSGFLLKARSGSARNRSRQEVAQK